MLGARLGDWFLMPREVMWGAHDHFTESLAILSRSHDGGFRCTSEAQDGERKRNTLSWSINQRAIRAVAVLLYRPNLRSKRRSVGAKTRRS